ncbi:MAG: restriction endonuclease subunit S [Flavobacterium sp.]|uniref:restriction endonuclease subunit S n=1 Tax=Flavobacterium sp. TaxID=239 RepID=UPI003267BACA
MKQEQLLNLPIEWKRGSGFRKSDLDEEGKNKCILYGELYTKHKNILIENHNISRTNKIGAFYSIKGDILVPGTSTASKKDMLLAREIDEDGVFLGGDINVIRPKQGIFAKKYLPYYFETFTAYDQLDRYITGATGIIHISNTGLKKLKVPLPTFQEQQRIVVILDEVFAAIAKAKANVEHNLNNAKELFKSELERVFSDKCNSREEKTIEEVCDEIFAGGDAPKNNFSIEKTQKFTIPIYANSVKKNGLYGFTNFARVCKPSITIAARGSGTGHTELRNEDYLPIVRLIVLIPNYKLMSLEFLKYKIDTLEILRSGSAIPQLTVPMIKEYKIPILSLQEQQNIVTKLDNLRAATKKLEGIYEQKLLDLEELKKSILQKAFSGELTSKSVII